MNTSSNLPASTAHPLRSHVYRDVARLAGEALAAGLVISLALALAIFIVSTHAEAAESIPGQGTLMLKSAAGEAPVAAPLLFTDVDIAVSGMSARATVTQRFANPTSEWQEGVYVFPLPEKAAVDHLEMKIGQRRIEGQIKERGEARAAYEQAKTEGRKATLVEQERPNVFTTSVAHIGPGEEITVTIEYQETLRYDSGAFRLRFPLVVAPRYVPGTFNVADKTASGSGSYSVMAGTTAVDSGTFKLTRLVAFQFYGCGEVDTPDGPITLPPDLCGGRALFAFHAISSTGEQTTGLYEVNCQIHDPGGQAPPGTSEGIKANARGINFNKHVTGDNLLTMLP